MFSLLRNSSLRHLPKLLEARSVRFFTSNTNGNKENATRSSNTTVDPKEVEQFSTVKDWWNPNGSQRGLHAYNYARVNYIKRMYDIHSGRQNNNKYALFQGLDILDVGSGPGLFCESAARLQGNVLGIDATPATVEIAKAHAKQDPSLTQNLEYRNITAEELVKEGKQFDIVTSLEVVEHVSDKRFFIEQITNLIKDNGFVFLSTINKTWLSYAVTILGAEILTRIVPRGTHEWEKYISPDDLVKIVRESGLKVINVQGFKYHPLTNKMTETTDTSVNYMVACRKE